MNIKGLNASPIAPVEPKKRVDGNSRTQNATDRDGNGRKEQGEPELNRHLSQQEFDDALKALGEMPGLKANNLTIKVETKEDCRTILILDPTGKVVRRLSEAQLWSATRDKDRQTGRILDKAM
jgi:hypothetical protein